MAKRTVPKIRSLSDIRGVARGPELIHLTAQQWQRVKRKTVPPPKGRPGRLKGLAVHVISIPDPDGGVLLMPECIPGRNEVCAVKQVWRDGNLVLECFCRPKNRRGGGISTGPLCEFGLGPRNFGCRKVRCPGQCRLEFDTSGANRIIFGTIRCVCRAV